MSARLCANRQKNKSTLSVDLLAFHTVIQTADSDWRRIFGSRQAHVNFTKSNELDVTREGVGVFEEAAVHAQCRYGFK